MRMMRAVMLGAMVIALDGCERAPPRYAVPSGMTREQGMLALSDCRGEATATFPQTLPISNPLFGLAVVTTVNVRQHYVDDCMAAQGFPLCSANQCRPIPTPEEQQHSRGSSATDEGYSSDFIRIAYSPSHQGEFATVLEKARSWCAAWGKRVIISRTTDAGPDRELVLFTCAPDE